MNDRVSPEVDAQVLRTLPAIELRAWQQFLAVARLLHFGRAAAELHMTQPPLTQAIALLEHKLGVRLFERNKRQVRITAAGAALVEPVQDVLRRAAALPEHARASARGELGRLRLAFVSTVAYDLLPQWVRGFRAAFPGVSLDLLEATGDVQQQMLAQRDIDAGLMLHTPAVELPGLQRWRVATEDLVLALPNQHAMALQADWSLQAVCAEPLVMFPRRILPSLYDALHGVYHACGHAPRVVQEAIQMQTIVNLVSAGLGVAWVPRSVMQFQRSGVVYREPSSAVASLLPACDTSLVWRTDADPPPLVCFRVFLQQQMAGSGLHPA